MPDCRIVEVRVKHHDGKGQDIGGVFTLDHIAFVVLEVLCGKDLDGHNRKERHYSAQKDTVDRTHLPA